MLLRRHHKEKYKEVIEPNNILRELTVKELKEEARHRGLEGYSTMKKEELIELIEGA